MSGGESVTTQEKSRLRQRPKDLCQCLLLFSYLVLFLPRENEEFLHFTSFGNG